MVTLGEEYPQYKIVYNIFTLNIVNRNNQLFQSPENGERLFYKVSLSASGTDEGLLI